MEHNKESARRGGGIFPGADKRGGPPKSGYGGPPSNEGKPNRPQFGAPRAFPPEMKAVSAWIQNNPTREIGPPTTAPTTAHKTVSTNAPILKKGPWPKTIKQFVPRGFPITGALLWATDYTWQNMDTPGKSRVCQEKLTELYIGWGEIFKTRGYKSLGWKALEIEPILAETAHDAPPASKEALHAIADLFEAQVIRVFLETREYDITPPEWDSERAHVVIAYEKGTSDEPSVPQIVEPEDGLWTVENLGPILKEYTMNVVPRRKELLEVTAAELKTQCSDAGLGLPPRTTKEQMWVALAQHRIDLVWSGEKEAV